MYKNYYSTGYVNMKAIFVVMNTTWAVVKIRPEKNSGLYGIWTHDLCDTGARSTNWVHKPTGSSHLAC